MSGSPQRVRVLMVCMGNICRSPTAEAVFRRKLEVADLAQDVEVDSAGTHAWHAGSPPDDRSMVHAKRRGYDLSTQRARAVRETDFERFDLILAMDWDNLELLEASCPAPFRPRLRRLAEFATRHEAEIVPDPYQGGASGFEHVLDLVEDACDGLLAHLQREMPVRRGGTS